MNIHGIDLQRFNSIVNKIRKKAYSNINIEIITKMLTLYFLYLILSKRWFLLNLIKHAVNENNL